ncbi:15470_t:CDS:2, partial [Cetraspora pellucida]
NFVELEQSTSHAAQLYCEALAKDSQNKKQAKSKSRLSGSLLFGLQCKSVEKVHKKLPSNKLMRIKSFNDYSASAQCQHILGLGKRLLEFVKEAKENFFHSGDNIILKQAKFEINSPWLDLIRAGAVYNMRQEVTNKVNKKIPISLVNIDQPTSFELITKESNIIDLIIVSNVISSISKGGQRRITDILNYIIPLYIQKEVLKPGSTLHLHISDDDRDVGKKVKHVIVTVALLNNLDKLHKSESYYMLVLFPDVENYYLLQNALASLISDLRFLSEHRFYKIGGRHVEHNTISKDMQAIKESYTTLNGRIRSSLFDIISIKHWVCDSLHIMLRVSDRFWKLFLSDL